MPEQDEKGRFVAGNSGNGGRPKGARSKLGEAFLEKLHADFQEGGAEAIERTRIEEPAQYVRVIASLLPKEVKIENAPLAELSDEELARVLDVVRTAIGPGAGDRGGAGATTH